MQQSRRLENTNRAPAETTGPTSGLVTCRAGLERVVARELRELGAEVLRIGTRAVFFRPDPAVVYRCNMGLHSALNVLLPIRTFNARNYEMLYYQARKTNWHKLFTVGRSIRIDVNGGSPTLRHTQYVTHRVKDGIVDTFRKLSGGIRPSVRKDDPDVHIVVHLDGPRVTLCLDTSGQPLFKRGYRTEHGAAPLKEDLAAGILQLAGWDGRKPLLDPLCGAGTFLFEAWLLAAGIAPNLDRRFAFESLLSYDPALHAAERDRLRARIRSTDLPELLGYERDPATRAVAEAIRQRHFPDAPIGIRQTDYRTAPGLRDGLIVCNPPYGVRLGTAAAAVALHRELGAFLRDACAGSAAAVFTANPEAAVALEPPVPRRSHVLYNGALEGRLLLW